MNEYKALTEFYPTPPELIARLISDVDITNIKYVLEPSAGKGDIVRFVQVAKDYIQSGYAYRDYLEKGASKDEAIRMSIENNCVRRYEEYKDKYYSNRLVDIDCIEIDSTLKAVLIGREMNVVDDDFLEFDGEKHYDLIVMNPPFSDGDKHLHKALDIAEKTGSVIRCILNAETIRNPYTNIRKALLQRLEKYGAEFEYVEGAFNTAERKTDVEVVIVKVTVPSPFGSRSRIIDELDEEEITLDEPDYDTYELVTADYMKQAVLMYKREIALGKKLIEEYLAVKPYITRMFEKQDTPEYAKGSSLYLVTDLKSSSKDLDFNEYVESVRFKYWHELLHNPSFLEGLTSNLRSEYFDNIKKLARKEFSLSNIYKVKIEVIQRMAQGVEDRIISLFEELTYKNSMDCEGNIHYFNGWKSNSAFIINPKVVVPYMDCWDGIFKKFKYSYGEIAKFLDDMQKTLDYLDGGDTDVNRDVYHWLNHYENIQETKKLRFKYFTVDVFKKGTIHIRFTEPDVLKKLNIYGCMKKGWLPPSYGKKSYKDMTEEEQAVIDEFEGEKEYQKVFAEKERFIVAPEKDILMLEGA